MSTFVKGPVDWEANAKNWGSTDQKDWRKRTIAIKRLLGDGIRSVIDVGAGSMFLGRLLPPEVRYYPLDHEAHCDETLVCDLNAYQFPDIKADAAVLAGIIEYLNDVDWLFDTLAERVSTIVLSYQGKEKGFGPFTVYTTDEIINKLRQRGFVLTGWDRELEDQWPLIGRFQKVTPQLLAANYFCTGCGACANSCGAGAIALKPDFQGFLKPQLDAAKCVGCDRCVEACPSVYLHENDHFADPDCHVAWAEDEIRMDSSSGGTFTVLAQHILKQGGTVFGAAWTEDFHLEHIGIRDVEELPRLRHSKYVQSNTKETFREVREILEGGSPVLYVGTPCQIAGLRAFLGKPYAELCTVDLICFCSGGPANAFRKYLAEQYGLENVMQVVFRDKQCGWSGDAYSIHKRDGSVLPLSIDTDDYQKAYHNVLLRNKTCEDCIYTDFPRQGDITLGDFWGIADHDGSWNDGKGAGMVLANSEKGRYLLDAVKTDFQRIKQVPLEWTRGKGNRIQKDGRARHKNAEKFLTDLDKHTFRESLDIALSDKHDIGLVCWNNDNYGNNLTNYALYQYLNDCGYSVAMISQAKDAPCQPYPKKFTLFGHIPYKPSDIFPDAESKLDQKRLNDTCGFFLVGSDQLFRARISEDLGRHPHMDWVTSNKAKVAYSISFGTETYEGDAKFKAETGYYLKRFQAISVREASGVRILKEDFGIDDAAFVLDPVFLCDIRVYEEMARFGKMRLPRSAYLGGYVLDPSPKKAALIDRILAENGLRAVSIISDGEEEAETRDASNLWDKPILRRSLVEEWLANVLYSDVFITDSFHGACFALMFQRDFWIITNDSCGRGGERLRSLVGMLGIENRLILEDADFSTVDFSQHIDYTVVTPRLSRRIKESKSWLDKALKQAQAYAANYDTYDVLGERIDANLIHLQRLERKQMDSVNQITDYLKDSTMQIQGALREELEKGREAEVTVRQQLQNMLENEIRKRQEAEQKLELALREKADLELHITSMYQSNSWQITWPLRKIRAIFRRLFGKIKSVFGKGTV